METAKRNDVLHILYVAKKDLRFEPEGWYGFSGCVWVYEARPGVHFDEHMFSQHYCDWGLYWFAWWTVTLHLVLIALLILLAVVFLALGLCKQNEGRVIR